jgi:hypothetical protein
MQLLGVMHQTLCLVLTQTLMRMIYPQAGLFVSSTLCLLAVKLNIMMPTGRSYAMMDVTNGEQASDEGQRPDKRCRVGVLLFFLCVCILSDIHLTGVNPSVIDLTPLSSSHIQPSVTSLLLKLDASQGAGLTECQFKALLTKCVCGLYMTKRSF